MGELDVVVAEVVAAAEAVVDKLLVFISFLFVATFFLDFTSGEKKEHNTLEYVYKDLKVYSKHRPGESSYRFFELVSSNGTCL